jgi:hypothetical protein
LPATFFIDCYNIRSAYYAGGATDTLELVAFAQPASYKSTQSLIPAYSYTDKTMTVGFTSFRFSMFPGMSGTLEISLTDSYSDTSSSVILIFSDDFDPFVLTNKV